MGFEVDPAFIQAPEHRPKPSVVEASGIPLIDLSPLRVLDGADLDGKGLPPALQVLVAEVEAACQDWGFFQVINHGVPDGVLEKAWAASKSFFALPLEEKRLASRDEHNPLGYYDTEHTKNVRDWKEVFDFAIEEPFLLPSLDASNGGGTIEYRNKWPEHLPGFREAFEEYGEAVKQLAFELLELIALTLNLPLKRLNGYFKDNISFIRLNHYPPCPSPHLALGVGRHKDAGALTVLAQDQVGGLECKPRGEPIDGEWIKVKPIPNSYIINVGDIIQVWSNDKYESAEHRVKVNSERERFSIPFFFNPAPNVIVKPLEELLIEGERLIAPNYEEYNWGEFFKTRRDSNFKKLEVENVQISHFKKGEVISSDVSDRHGKLKLYRDF